MCRRIGDYIFFRTCGRLSKKYFLCPIVCSHGPSHFLLFFRIRSCYFAFIAFLCDDVYPLASFRIHAHSFVFCRFRVSSSYYCLASGFYDLLQVVLGSFQVVLFGPDKVSGDFGIVLGSLY